MLNNIRQKEIRQREGSNLPLRKACFCISISAYLSLVPNHLPPQLLVLELSWCFGPTLLLFWFSGLQHRRFGSAAAEESSAVGSSNVSESRTWSGRGV